MAEENKSCSLAVHLAMAALRGNEEMMKRLIDMSNQMNADYLFHDMLNEGADLGITGESGKIARELNLKGQSTEMKFKSLLFSGVLANTVQGDEALNALFNAIKETGGAMAEGADLLQLAAKMDLSQMEEVAKVLGTDIDGAKKFVEEARKKISDFIASEYSVVSTGTSVKPSKLKPKIEKQIAKATVVVDEAKESLGSAYKDVDKDLKRLQSKPKGAVNYWSKKEGKEELQKLQQKYKTKSASKKEIEAKLVKIKNAEDTIKKGNAQLKQLDREYQEALEADLKAVKDGQNPFNYTGPDAEWKFNKGFNNNISNRVLEYGQYVLARTLLTSDNILPQSIYTALTKLVKQYSGKGVSDTSGTQITEDWILDPDRTLDELLAAAYINTRQLCMDGGLRKIYRQRLTSLVSDGALSMDDISAVNTMMETLRFSGEGAGFSDILKYSMLKENAKELLGDTGTTLTGKELRNNIVDIFQRDDFDKIIKSGDTITLNDGTKITTRQLLEFVTSMVGELNLYRLIASNDFTDKAILDIAGEYLVGDVQQGRQKILNLVDVVRKTPTSDDTRGIILKALTGKNVASDVPVGYFDFRKELSATEDVKARAQFRDRLADANKVYIPDTGIQDLTTTNGNKLAKDLERYRGGFILVTDSQWGLNKTLSEALDSVNYENGKLVDEKRRVSVIFPKAGLMGKVQFENGKLLFKTSYSSLYDTFLRKVSMRTFSEVNVNSKLNQDILTAMRYGDDAEVFSDAIGEFNKALEEDARKYFGAMIGEDPLSDRLPALLEQATGISFKNYDAIIDKADFWRMVDDRFMLGLKTMGNYDQELVTVADVIKQVDSMTPAEIAADLSSKYGFEIPTYRIADGNGKVRKEVRDAYLNYNLSQTHLELLERKGKLLSVINGGVADNITTNQFKSMWQSGDFSAYKDIFFHDLELTDEELAKHTKAINDMIFEGLCLQLADNLVAMGYSLPLVNIRDLVFDYLNGKLNVNGDFARAFLYKNNLPDTISTLRGIVEEAMPEEMRFGYDDAVKQFDYDGFDRLGQVAESRYNKQMRYTETILSDGTVLIDGERLWGEIADWMNLTDSFLEINTPSVINGKTVRELADEYNIPLFIAQDAWLANFSKTSLGRTNWTRGKINGKDFVQTMINLRRTIPEGTASHELFHAVFFTLSPKETNYFIDQAEKLYKLDPSRGHREANEMLADLFSEYFRTGSFTLPNAKKLQKNASFRAWIVQWFQKISNWLLGIDGYEKDVAKLFDDILNGKLKTTTKQLKKGEIEAWNKANTQKWKDYLVNINNQQKANRPVGKVATVVTNGKTSVQNWKDSLNSINTSRREIVINHAFDAMQSMYKALKDGTASTKTFDEWKNSWLREYELEYSNIDDETKAMRGVMYRFFSKVSDGDVEKIKNVDDFKNFILDKGTGLDEIGYNINTFNQEGFSSSPDQIMRMKEVQNPFMQDTYSALTAMAVIKDKQLMANAGAERQVLKGILDSYYNAVKQATEGGKTLSFSEAQKLKIQAGYALDMFEQDFISPRYKQFLTPDEKNQLFGLRYALGVATNADSLETIAKYNQKILDRYDNSVKNIIDTNNDIKSLISPNNNSINEEIEKRNKELIQKGATMKVVGGDIIVIDTREELLNQIRNLPDSVMGLDVLKSLGREGLNQLSNEQAYFLLQLVELTRNADNRMNMVTGTIYKLNPQLARIDFFNTYKVVNGLPKALGRNLLTGTEFLSKLENTSVFDTRTKETIFGRIKDAFAENGKLGYYKKKAGIKVYVDEYEHLQEIIADSIDINIKELANSVKGGDLKKLKKEATYIYQNAFSPYTILKDIPDATKRKIDDILTTQQKGIMDAMDLLGTENRIYDVMDGISIMTDTGEIKTFRQILQGDEVNLSKLMFDTDSDIIKTADELSAQKIDPTLPESDQIAIRAQNKKLAEAAENNYNDALQAYLNNSEIVGQGEREILERAWASARQVAKKYTLTNKLADTDNALAGINEEIIRGFKADILGFVGNITAGGQLFGTKGITKGVLDRWEEVQISYKNLYSMSYEQLTKYTPKSPIDEVALNLAKYFKEIERRCGSIDGITGATTKQEINQAFAHLGEVVLNIKSIEGLFSLMSGIEGNQILKFFRFSEPGQLSRVNDFIIGNVGDYWVGGYRNYVDKTDEGLNRKWFNETFGANFDDDDYQKLIQALCGFTVVNKKMKWLMNTLNFINSSNYLTRALLSYPGQFLTIGNQTIAYFLKQKGREKELGAEDLGTIDKVRKSVGILNGAYNEINIGEGLKKIFRTINPDSTDANAFYNRYGLPDVDDLMSKEKFYTSDDISSIYAKIDNYGSDDKLISWSKFLRNTDAYKDNANNIIDGLYARNYKNIAFVKALHSNRYMNFATAEQFAKFLSSDAPGEMKRKLLDAVTEESGKNFRNILGLGFSGLDRATGGGWLKNIFIALGQMFNFRGAWGQNMARQTSNWIIAGMKMARKGLSKEGKDAIAEYIAKQPEFINFTTQLFNDLHNVWRLTKYQDNGDYLPERDEYSLMDFLEYSYETMQFASQWWQGIQSYGLTRILTAGIESAVQSYINPDVYKDTFGVGALMNAISKNLGRNWKVLNLFTKGTAYASANGWRGDVLTQYLSNEFWKLSFGSLRYLMNEDETNYGYSTELINSGAGGIPFIITGETDIDGDKAYSYDMAGSETWLNLTSWYDALKKGDSAAAREYLLNNIDSFYNASQMFNFVRNIGKTVAGSDLVGDKIKDWLADGTIILGRVYPMGSPFDLAEAGEIIRDTDVGNIIMRGFDYVPTDVEDIKILMDEVISQANHRPGNDGFNKSMFNFDESGHMKNLEESNEADASMELLLNNIKYVRDDNYNFVLDEKGNRIVNPEWTIHMNDMQMRFNDENYMTNSNYNFINSWVERHNDDPNYMLYKRLIAEGEAGRYADQQLQKEIDWYNKAYGLKGDYKVTKTKLQDSHKNYSEIYANLPSVVSTITGQESGFLESLINLDRPAANRAYIKMIERQLGELGDTETLQKLFKIDEDGNIKLSSRYQSYIEEQAKLSEMLRDGDLEGFKAETASITEMFSKEDPYGLATTVLISSRINRINQAENLSEEQKAKAIESLLEGNYEFIQQHIPEFINELGDSAKAYVSQMNNSLYDISQIGDLLTYQNEMGNSKSGRSSSINISGMSKSLLGQLGKSTGTGDGVGGGKQYDYNIIPVKLDGAKLLKATGGKGYTPKTAASMFLGYTPHVKFSIGTDINRTISGPKTQTITKKKQLSKLESDATKALEAES